MATVDGVELVRYLDGGNGYCGSSELLLHIGLGAATEVTQLRVEWARGYVTTLSGVAADQRLTITAPRLADLDGNGTVGNADVQLLVAAWGEVTPETLHCDLNNDGFIGRRDLAIILGAWESR